MFLSRTAKMPTSGSPPLSRATGLCLLCLPVLSCVCRAAPPPQGGLALTERRVDLEIRDSPFSSAVEAVATALKAPVVAAIPAGDPKISLVARDAAAPAVLDNLVRQAGQEWTWAEQAGVIVIHGGKSRETDAAEGKRTADHEALFQLLSALRPPNRERLLRGEAIPTAALVARERQAMLSAVRALDETTLTAMEQQGVSVTISLEFVARLYLYTHPAIDWERTGIPLW
ncbi:MAG: hypothetical protein COZ06_10850 [Armatimonadetes bacterium CG_4_10_14_3_um_filter_66_18]|nr:MAG: hypothetical protein COS65_15810 [Armatimonadetes bacterium CG06_land_8_20_14_3_00_66_21]PIY50153.1 MAG: hypothetical protein COZ06_10850 [Armatimonadetes bacterium CG_4_10_14_3_um_filter_66_18]